MQQVHVNVNVNVNVKEARALPNESKAAVQQTRAARPTALTDVVLDICFVTCIIFTLNLGRRKPDQ